MIRLARLQDISEIMQIVQKTIKIMLQENSTQWDNFYPTQEIFENDITNNWLYVAERSQKIMGFICLNFNEAKEYSALNWNKKKTAMVIHRLAVLPEMRGKKIAQQMIDFAEENARQNQIFYIKTDTYSINNAMNNLLKKNYYKMIGSVSFFNKPHYFYCYEKILNKGK